MGGRVSAALIRASEGMLGQGLVHSLTGRLEGFHSMDVSVATRTLLELGVGRTIKTEQVPAGLTALLDLGLMEALVGGHHSRAGVTSLAVTHQRLRTVGTA